MKIPKEDYPPRRGFFSPDIHIGYVLALAGSAIAVIIVTRIIF